MKEVVDEKFQIYHDSGDFIQAEYKALCSSNANVVEPIFESLLLLQSQIFSLGIHALEEAMRYIPNMCADNFQEQDRNMRMELWEKEISQLLAYQDLDDLSLKNVDEDMGDESSSPAAAARPSRISLDRSNLTSEQEKEKVTTGVPRGDGLETNFIKDSDGAGPEESNISVPEKPLEAKEDDSFASIEVIDVKPTPTHVDKPIVIRRLRSVFDYTGQSELELDLEKGDIVGLYRMEFNGWWEGRCERTQRIGLFPFNYMEQASDT